MIEEKFVDLYARNSGLRDKLVAERDVVLTYALRALFDADLMNHLAFKGGTCLRKLIFGSSGRFSEDLDFTLDSDEPEDDVLARLVETFNGEHHGITFTLYDYYKTDEKTSFGGEVLYRHAWNAAGRFHLQVSLRERPTLPVALIPMKPQGYFGQLEFALFDVPSLQTIEMIAEKVRAAFQRTKVRDLYDLHRFAPAITNGRISNASSALRIASSLPRSSPSSRTASTCSASSPNSKSRSSATPTAVGTNHSPGGSAPRSARWLRRHEGTNSPRRAREREEEGGRPKCLSSRALSESRAASRCRKR